MKKSIKNMKKVVLAIIFCITLLMPISVSAEEYSQNSSETAVQLNEIIEEKDSVIQEKDQQIEELIEQNNRNQKTIEDYRALYSTWTGIVAVLLAVFGVAIPIILPFIINKINKPFGSFFFTLFATICFILSSGIHYITLNCQLQYMFYSSGV